MLLYSVTIHKLDDEGVESEAWLESKYHRHLWTIAKVRMLASSRRKAAAKAYVAVLGRMRARFFADTKAHPFIILGEVDVRRLARTLKTETLGNGEHFVTWHNPCETLYIQVNRIRISKLELQTILARRKRRQQCRRRRILRFLLAHLEN